MATFVKPAVYVVLFALLCMGTTLNAATVGVKVSEPFVMETTDGYSGISIDLWEATNPGKHKYVKYDTVESLLSAVESGDVESGVAPISVTSDRAKRVDFTQPYYQSGLSYAIAAEPTLSAIVFSVIPKLLYGIGAIFMVMFVAGMVFAIIEHKRNDDVESNWTSVFRGIYWATATATTVGYGDVAAKTPMGRAYSTVCMWGGLVITGTLTAIVVSAVNLETAAYETFNIYTSDIAVIEGSAGAEYVNEIAPAHNVHYYFNVDDAIESLHSGKIDAIVHDMPILKYAFSDSEEIVVSDTTLTEENYAFAVQKGSGGLDSINVPMLEFVESNTWKNVVQSYH